MPVTRLFTRSGPKLDQQSIPLWPLPKWLPAPIQGFVESLFRSYESASFESLSVDGNIIEVQTNGPLLAAIWRIAPLRERLKKLTTRKEMKSVWQLLNTSPLKSDLSNTPDTRNLILTGYLQTALAWNWPSPSFFEQIPTAKQQRENLRRAAQLAHQLRELLGPPDDLYRFTLWNVIDSKVPLLCPSSSLQTKRLENLVEDERSAVKMGWDKLARLRAAHRDFSWSGSPDSPLLSARPLFPWFSLQLEVLERLAQSVAGMTLEPPPKRSRTRFQIQYIRQLSGYVRKYLDQPLSQAVATTANVALDPQPPTTRQQVQQLFKGA